MKRFIGGLVALVAGLSLARGEDAPLQFGSRAIEKPALSLLGAAAEAVQQRLGEVLAGRAGVAGQTRTYSRMPIMKPDESIDRGMVKAPDASRDYKLQVIKPKVESEK